MRLPGDKALIQVPLEILQILLRAADQTRCLQYLQIYTAFQPEILVNTEHRGSPAKC